MNPLLVVCPDELNAVTDGDWEEIELAADSGASEAVINDSILATVMARESNASKKMVAHSGVRNLHHPRCAHGVLGG